MHNIVNTALFTLYIDLLWVLCYALTIKRERPVLTEVISYGNYSESNCEICGVSRGTVDRALHNKGNVRPAVAERIKAVAAEYGYIPNRAGLALSRASHPIRIGVIMISVQTPFMQLVLDAARREARRLAAFSVEVIFRLSTSLDPVEQVSMIENLVEQHHISALAITPLDCLLVETKINELIDNAEYRSLRLTPICPTAVGCAMSGRKTFLPDVRWPSCCVW